MAQAHLRVFGLEILGPAGPTLTPLVPSILARPKEAGWTDGCAPRRMILVTSILCLHLLSS